MDEVAQVPVANEPQQSKPVEEIPQDQIDLTAYNQTGYIPEPPSIVDENIVLNALGEPALQQLGLASYYTPIGWVQNCIEYFHASLGMPWFASIALFAVCMRFCLFPITVKSQQNAAKMKKIAPLTNRLKEKLNEAKLSGDSLKGKHRNNVFSVIYYLRFIVNCLDSEFFLKLNFSMKLKQKLTIKVLTFIYHFVQ